VEAIAAKNPDLVVTGYDTNNLAANLKKVNIPVLLVNAPANVDQAYQVWTAIGKATGHQPQADGLVSSTRADIAKTVASTPKPAKPLHYYYELDQTFYTATSHTFIGSLLGQFGLTNIGDPADTASTAGYPQLSAERILSANPDLIFLADDKCCGQNASTVGARPGWNTITAVHNGNVVALDDDIASRWGPRITDLMHTVSAAVTKAGHQSGS
jgi:iron complex transport system substrate-binding protein